MHDKAILLPLFAMTGLIAVVWVKLLWDRIGEMRARRIPAQAVATSAQLAGTLRNTQAADNFRNLFEVPVLLYALCLAAFAADTVSISLIAGAWLFVLLRAVHSLIQCTYNNVWHRFSVYLASTLLLFLLWILFLAQVSGRLPLM